MANIQYSSINNTCFNDRLGNIIINQINFTSPSEQTSFASYNIVWSGDFYSLSQISADGKLAEFLENGNYSFSIFSLIDSSVLGPYNITISSPPELKITDIKYQKYSCAPNDSSIRVYVSGGTPPYVITGNSTASDETFDTEIELTGLNPNTFDITVIDANSCSYTWPVELEIKDSTIALQVLEALGPTLLDSYGYLRILVEGYGPFSLWFENNATSEVTYIDSFATEYISSASETSYEYIISDKLNPGSYTVTIKNNFGCSLIETINIPNILPMIINCTVVNNDMVKAYDAQLTLPIFDTILVPYKHIQNNSTLWQLIKSLNLKDTIYIKINNDIRQYKIVRNMLDKYCLDNNKIEILRLGNNSNDWFFYFYVAPAINLNDGIDIVNASFQIVNPHTNESHDMILGLNEYNSLDSEKPSLIRGSFLLNGLEHAQFVNPLFSNNVVNKRNNAYISVGDESLEEYDFVVNNISKVILKNTYAAGYITSINFLEQFNKLNIYVNLNDTACNTTMDEYQYLLNIKNLLKSINNLNNVFSIYIYNLDNISNIGQVILSIIGNQNFQRPNNQTVTNTYDVSYYTFDEESISLKTFYRNNSKVKTTSLQDLVGGYIIIRIRDIYNNIPRTIIYGNNNINYDSHFSIAKNIIQKFNKNITEYFEYGDILVFVSSADNPNPPIDDPLVPRPPVINPPTPEPVSDSIVLQTPDQTNTATLTVSLLKNIKCIIHGPKNYRYTITQDTEFRNMIPGVYTIRGDEQELYNNNLYQQEYRLLIEKNTTNTLDIDFVSYQDKTFIKEIE